MKLHVQIGLAIAAVAAFSVLALYNHGPVALRLWGALQWKIPLVLLLGAAFAGGVLLVLIIMVAGKTAGAYGRRMYEWKPRAVRLARGTIKRGYEAMERGEEHLSRDDFLKAQDLAPLLPDSYVAMAEWFMENQSPQDALGEIRKAVSLRPREPVYLEKLARIALEAGEPESAAEALVKLRKLRPESKYAIKTLPKALAGLGRWEEALEAQKKYISGLPKNERFDALQILNGLKTELAGTIRRDKPARARKLLREVLKESPDFVPAALLLSDVDESLGKIEEARNALLCAFSAKPQVVLYERLAGFDGGQGEVESIAARAIEENPQNHALICARARQRLLRGEAGQAKDDLEKIAGESGWLKQMLLMVAKRQIAPESADDAEKSLLRALTIDHCCSACGFHADGWVARCPECGKWDKMVADLY